jgi:hypothetical protein
MPGGHDVAFRKGYKSNTNQIGKRCMCTKHPDSRAEVLRQAYRMAEQGIPVPNPDLYKKWRDSGLMPGAGSYREWLQEQGIKSDGTPLSRPGWLIPPFRRNSRSRQDYNESR